MKPNLRLPLSLALVCGVLLLGFAFFGTERTSRIATPEVATESEARRDPITLRDALDDPEQRERLKDYVASTAPAKARSNNTSTERPDPIVIRGQVVDRDDRPIQDASLLLSVSRNEKPSLLAQADSAGRLLARLELAGIDPDLAQRLIVVAPGFERHTQFFLPAPGNAVDLGKLVLLPGSEITGTVYDPGGVPLPGVLVSAGPAASSHYGWDEVWVNGTTDANGTFALRGIGAGRRIVHARRGALKTSSHPFTLEAGTPLHIELSLQLAEELTTFQVLDPSGAPHGDAKIELFPEPGSARFAARTSRFETEADGSAAWSTKIHTHARALDASGRYAATSRVRFQPGAHVVLRFVQRPGVQVRLRTPPGDPVAWGQVRLSEHEVLMPGGADGRFEFPLPEEPFELEAFAPGFRRGLFGPYTPTEVREPITLWLERGDSLHGIVRHRGQPVAGARIGLTPLSELSFTTTVGAPFDSPFHHAATIRHGLHDATTSAAGEFVLSLHAEGRFAVSVEADGFPLQVFGPWNWSPADEPSIEIDVARSGALQGRVLGARPIDRQDTLVAAYNGWGYVHTTPIRTDGTYRFEGLAPGPWQVRPGRAPGASLLAVGNDYRQAEEERSPHDVVVEPSATSTFDLDLDRHYRCVLEGQLEQPDVFGSWVQLRNEDGPVAAGTLDVDGRFVLRTGYVGPARLTLGNAFPIRADLELRPGVQRWSEKVMTGWIRFVPGVPREVFGRLVVSTQLSGGSVVEQSFRVTPGPGTERVLPVPSGLSRISFRTYRPENKEPLGELYVDPGEEADFLLE